MNNRLAYPLSKYIIAYLLWWLFLGIVHTLVLHRLELPWDVAIIDAVISNTLLALISFLTIIVYRYYQPQNNNHIYRFIFGIVLSIKFCFLLKYILSHILYDNTSYIQFLEKSMPIRFVFALPIAFFIIIFNWWRSNLLTQKETEKRQATTDKLMKDVELNMLRQQLQPHFLFNSLNSINALVVSKPQEARMMVQQLSDFLRITLKKEHQQLTSISEELEHLMLYLDIEKVRFGYRLTIDIDIDSTLLNDQLPSLILQPIVENAIKFGLYNTTGNITIHLSAHKDVSNLYIQVKNPYDAQTQLSQKGIGFGLSSIQRRLYLLYARNDLLIVDTVDNTFITKLKIPLHETNYHHR